MSEQKHTIHIRIRDLRRERALTQEELAAALGLSRQSINAMEAGRCLPSLPVALQIASYFAVPLSTMFDLMESANQQLEEATQASLVNPQQEQSMSNLTPWSPLKEMREALDELIDESNQWQGGAQISVPAANISQTATEIQIELYLPGYQKDQLSIEVGEDFVTIAGEARNTGENGEYYRREFVHSSFQRSLSLPSMVQVGEAEAEMKHGVLTIRIPKVIEEKPKTARISIKSLE